MRLYQRFIVILLLVAVLPLAIFGFRAFHDASLTQQETLQFHRYLVTAHAEQVNQFFKSLNLNLSFVIDFERRPNMPYADRQSILINALTYRRDLQAIVLVSSDGKELNRVVNERVTMPDSIALSLDPGFQKALSTRRLQITSPLSDGKHVSIFLFYPMSFDSVFCMKADLGALMERLRSVRIGATGRMWLLADQGTPVLKPEEVPSTAEATITNALAKTTAAWEKELQEASDNGNASPSTTLEARTLRAGNWVGAFSPIPQMGWSLAFIQDAHEAFSTGDRIRKNATFWVVVGFIGMLAGAWFMSRDLAGPILRLSHAALQVAESRFDVRVEPQGPIEMEQLAATFNTMTKRLQDVQDLQVERMIAEKTKLEAVVGGISDGIIITDFRGSVIFCNDQATGLMNVTDIREDSPVEKLLHAPGMMQEVNKVITRRHDQASFSAEIPAKPEKRYLKGGAVLLRTSQGKELGVMIAIQDVTLDKRIEQLREDFLHMITHDLRGPLTAIQGYTRLLLSQWMGQIDNDMQDILRRSEQATLDLLDMVSNILDVRKYQTGEILLEIDPVPVSKLLEEIRERHSLVFKMRELNFTIQNDAGDAFLEADKDLLKRVINNLLGNAGKFTPSGGTVSIHVSADANAFVFQVRDTGRGIPADKIGQLFQKYTQVSTQDRIKGTGLGLSICKMIVEAHGGQIGVTSQAGKGSCFEFRIPKVLPSIRPSAQKAAA